MKRDLLFGMALLAGLTAQAAVSPFAGSSAQEGTFYLYQVETGQWLQPNRTDINQWTTYGTLGDTGLDIRLIKPEGFEGFQIFCNFTGNGSLNGADEDRFFLDQNDRDITDWIFEPVETEGVSNTFRIKAKATPEGTGDRSKIENDIFIGANDGQLSDNPTDFTWQLVSREERLQKMIAASADGPVDATWLIPWNDLGRNDIRDRSWQRSSVNNFGGGQGFDGSRGYPVQEYWHMITMRNSYTLTDLPTGTYGFSVQAFYRDTEIENEELAQRYLDGTEALRARYFAGSASAPVMSIFADAPAEQADGYTYFVEKAGKWVPNSMGDASLAMFNGAYVNEYIQAPVSDGVLTIGIEKTEADHRDWLIYKRLFLKYMGQELIAEDLSPLQSQLSDLIAEAGNLPATPSFIIAVDNAKAALESAKSASALLEAIGSIQAAVDVVKNSRGDIQNFYAVKALTDAMGLDTAAAVERFNNAVSRDDYSLALTELRYARRYAAADKQEDVFEGSPVQAGEFYLYNVGRKQFLSGGSDWGAHAALSMPGWAVTLEEENAEANAYHINTNLFNGPDNHYLNYRGYMDAPKAGAWKFIPVDGKENVYNIVQNDYQDVTIIWNPFASTDGRNNDETTVCCEEHNVDLANPNAQWKLVSRAEREALLEKASIDNPVDASFLIKSPGFNQREGANEAWQFTNGNIWEYGANHYDFAAESWNTTDCDFNQMVEGLPAGVYMASVQGFYRDGHHGDQVNNPRTQNAFLYFGQDSADDVALPNIMAESGKAPGEGNDATDEEGNLYNYPDGIVQATNFFKNGLYRVSTVVDNPDGGSMILGVYKEVQGGEGDWVVADNFRLTYYGPNTTVEEVRNLVSSAVETIETAPASADDSRIYNLQGIQVANPSAPGVYIRGGKKFVVK